MTKMYYTNPHAAAYMAMAKEFRVKFEEGKMDERFFRVEVRIIHDGIPDFLILRPKHEKFYIHPDSYDIFEPQVGDMVKDSIHGILRYVKKLSSTIKGGNKENYYTLAADSGVLYKIHSGEKKYWKKIIQRNNKPFFHPEEEE